MIFIHLLQGSSERYDRAEALLYSSKQRGEELVTSHLVLGEVMVGGTYLWKKEKAEHVRSVVYGLGFRCIPFDDAAVGEFARLRSMERVKQADGINLACAAAAGVDMFLTADKGILRLRVPGIQSIVDFYDPVPDNSSA